MKREVRIGTCGFRMKKEEYVGRLSTVEIQHTFYQPPRVETLKSWRDAMPPDFEFTLKAWQLITHEGTSPTYRRMRRQLSESEAAETGFFKPTEIVREGWLKTLESARALNARTILFQCPPKFTPTDENLANLTTFFSTVERDGLNFCWEPRGDWPDEIVRDICRDLDLWHAVDPFSRATVTPKRCYFRMHGRRAWRYEYEESELDELTTLVPDKGLSYVFFNNITMTRDAETFQRLVGESD